MKYKDAIRQSMEEMARNERAVFLGYGVRYGNRGGGSFATIPDRQLIETPVAENLMAGLAIGLSLEGYLPVVFFERFDFVLNALDAIVNHLDKLEAISRGEFRPRLIVRIVVGNRMAPLFTGVTHTQDFTDALSRMVTSLRVVKLPRDSRKIIEIYREAAGSSCIIVEEKDAYDVDC